MKITPATFQDQSGIKALLRICELPVDDLNEPHLVHFFAIKDAGEIVGCVGLEICGQFGLLRSLALAQSLRGRGLGIRLVEQIEEHARSLQIQSLFLLTTTADGFFAHNGYQVMPRQTVPDVVRATAEFQSICPASAVCMYKELQ